MIAIENKKYYTLKEVSEMFHTTTATVSRWRREGKLNGILIGERKYIFDEIEIKKMVGGNSDKN